ncbi:hypothetical protein NPX13_g7673 [Xylaria arbuscula]|uniref:Uncharacterized protein n=1 Tax=Xylaria arbuscula TaxID=114810 RepID=A0A9W8N9K4_9PEZI|nr:hypothetical protein NPX13_g7673 [Xylaria arbuscula]
MPRWSHQWFLLGETDSMISQQGVWATPYRTTQETEKRNSSRRSKGWPADFPSQSWAAFGITFSRPTTQQGATRHNGGRASTVAVHLLDLPSVLTGADCAPYLQAWLCKQPLPETGTEYTSLGQRWTRLHASGGRIKKGHGAVPRCTSDASYMPVASGKFGGCTPSHHKEELANANHGCAAQEPMPTPSRRVWYRDPAHWRHLTMTRVPVRLGPHQCLTKGSLLVGVHNVM